MHQHSVYLHHNKYLYVTLSRSNNSTINNVIYGIVCSTSIPSISTVGLWFVQFAPSAPNKLDMGTCVSTVSKIDSHKNGLYIDIAMSCLNKWKTFL